MSSRKTPGRRGRSQAGDDARIPRRFPVLSALIRQEPPPESSAKSAAGTSGQADAKVQSKGSTGRRNKKYSLPIGKDEPGSVPFQVSEIIRMGDVKRAYLSWVLGQLKGNKGERMEEAASLTGISKRTMYYWFGDLDDEQLDSCAPATSPAAQSPSTAAGRTGPVSRRPVDAFERLLGGSTMPPSPRIGDIVSYVSEGGQYPAIVVKVHDPDDPQSALSLAYFTPEPCSKQTVAYSAAAEPGGWCWRDSPST